MKIGIIGLSHLGLVYTAGFFKLGNEILAVDQNAISIAKEVSEDRLRVFEAGLNDLLKSGISAKRINLTDNFALLRDYPIAILSLDTPLDKSENIDLGPIYNLIDSAAPHLADGSLFLVSSQVIVGTCGLIQEKINYLRPQSNIEVAYLPENIRVGQALEYFFEADRFVIGVKTQSAYKKTLTLLEPIKAPKIRMGIESAEVSKHALNAHLALQVSFINEIADICDACGADIAEVAKALKSDSRIGPKAYLGAGLGITSPPLLRELKTLTRLAQENNLNSAVINGILQTNSEQPKKITAMLKAALKIPPPEATVGIFGLSYKEGTRLSGKSAAPFIIGDLKNSGIHCRIYQPDFTRMQHRASGDRPYSIAKNCNALLFLNPEKQFLDLDFGRIANLMRYPKIIFDARNFLSKTDMEIKGFRYMAIGRKGAKP